MDFRKKPLDGVVVLDLSHAYSGPFATMHLADQGAHVYKIEVPGVGDQSRGWGPFKNDKSGYFSYINRNKFGLSINLKIDEGKKIFYELVKKADVVVENMRIGTADKLGIGYDKLKEINEKIIYASISGYGIGVEEERKPCYDIIAQARGGLMGMTGFGKKTKAGPAIADNYSGTYLALGIVMALFERERTGQGRRLDVAMVDTIFSVLEGSVMNYTLNGDVDKPNGNADTGIAPFDSFEAKDGDVVIACGTQGFFNSLTELMGQPELSSDPKYADNRSRSKNYIPDLQDKINAWTRKYTMDELDEMISGVGIPFGKVMSMDQVVKQGNLIDRNMLWTVQDNNIKEEIQIPGTPIKMHGSIDKPLRAAPEIGQHNDEILRNILQKTDKEIEYFREKGAIG